MTIDTSSFKTPEEFISYYTEQIQNELGVYDIQASKVGFLGYFLNILGWTTYDNREYMDMLFKEAFVGTSQQDDNLFLHGSLYGYLPSLATPATASGNFSIDFSLLPTQADNIIKREVYFNYASEMIDLNIADIKFSSQSKYTFINEGGNYTALVRNESGELTYIPASTPQVSATFSDIKQQEIEVIEYTLPNYDYGSFHQYTIEVDSGYYISDIQVYVTEAGTTNENEYTVKYVKWFEDSYSQSVFFRKIASTKYSIEFGSGIRGKWIPSAKVKIKIYKTVGNSGNINKSESGEINTPSQLVVIDYASNGTTSTQTLEASKYLTCTLEYASDGKDPSTGDDLRKEVVEFVQSRDNFISEKDFYNITKKYMKDFRFLFKKVAVFDNLFLLLKAMRNKYQTVVKTFNETSEIFPSATAFGIITGSAVSGGNLTPGTYYYLIRAYDKFNNIISSTEQAVVTDDTNKTVSFAWAPISNAEKYRIYGRENTNKPQYWEVLTNSFQDDGSAGTSGYPVDLSSYSIYKPQYVIENETFVSPFLYKYNQTFDWYDGYLFYENIIKYFQKTAINENLTTPVSIPTIFINLKYDETTLTTIVKLKSFQDISEWSFELDIPELNYYELDMSPIDDNTFEYRYSLNNGIIYDNFQINIRGKNSGVEIFSAGTGQFQQVYDFSDFLKLPIYYIGTQRYVVNIPLILKSEFNDDPNYFLDQIKSFVNMYNFKENRMIGDDVQFRFLNSHYVKTSHLENSTEQGNDIIGGINWLSPAISVEAVVPIAPENKDRYIIGNSTIPILSTENTGTEYLITVAGNYTTKLATENKIRIKNATTSGVSGIYTVLSATYTSPNTVISVVEELQTSTGEGTLYYATDPTWRMGGPDNIAQYDFDSSTWVYTTTLPGNGIKTISDNFSYIYSKDFEFIPYKFKFPLLMNIGIRANKENVVENKIDLISEKDTILTQIADKLQTEFTGTDIEYYNGKIIDFIISNRSWIKDVTVTVTDSSTPKNELPNGIETKDDTDLLDLIKSNKLEVVKYTSAFYWWDINNINVSITVI